MVAMGDTDSLSTAVFRHLLGRNMPAYDASHQATYNEQETSHVDTFRFLDRPAPAWSRGRVSRSDECAGGAGHAPLSRRGWCQAARPRRREDSPPDLYCQVLVEFADVAALERMMASAERLALRPQVRELVALFAGTVSHIDYEVDTCETGGAR